MKHENGEEVSYMVLQSWTNEQMLEELTVKQRNGEMVEGVIRSIAKMKFPKKQEDGKVKLVDEETLIVALPGGFTGYCPASEFRDRTYRNYSKFLTQKESFIITNIDLNEKIAVLSAVKASEQLREAFWDEVVELAAKGTLGDKVFTGTVTGHNLKNRTIYVRIQGQDTYMFRNEWSWNENEGVDAQEGEQVEVKILKFEPKEKLIRVSRKSTLPDPFAFFHTLRIGQMIAGKVVNVHDIHGLFVEVENGIVLKAGKKRSLEEPDIGDYVSCRVQKLEPEKKQGKVTILSYPRGKRKKRDVGSFLFES